MSKHLRASAILLSEDFSATADKPTTKPVQLLKTGTFHDKRYGKFNVTRKMFGEMIKNFQEGIRGVVPALDYAHNTEGVAAGWFKNVYEKNINGDSSELWADIEYTPRGQKTLSDKEFGYLSADFDTNYIDNENKKSHGCVLLGAGLTNRPVIKGMQPAIQLSEQGDNMDPKEKELADQKAAEEKKLSDDKAAADAKLAAFDKIAGELGVTDPEALIKKIAEMKAGKKDEQAPPPPAEEKKEETAELGETKKQLAEAQSTIAKMKKEETFRVMLSEGKVVEAQRQAFLADDMIEFAKNSQNIKLADVGHGQKNTGTGGTGEKDFQDEIIEKSKAIAAEKKISMADAQRIVLSENAELAKKYNSLI